MTKKSKKKNNFENAYLNEYKKKNTLPFVSVCTPTYNRRPFIDYTIKCFFQRKNRFQGRRKKLYYPILHILEEK